MALNYASFFCVFCHSTVSFYRFPIEISFTATEQKEVNFNVVCHVKKKISPLTLNVKAEGYAMNAQLICEDSLGNKVELTSNGTNRINLGMVSETVRWCSLTSQGVQLVASDELAGILIWLMILSRLLRDTCLQCDYLGGDRADQKCIHFINTSAIVNRLLLVSIQVIMIYLLDST